LYEWETWSLTLREERRLRVFENRVLRKKRDEVTGEWRRQRNEELHDFYSPNIIRAVNEKRMKCTGHIARMGNRRGAHRVLVEKHERKSQLGRIILKWVFKKGDGGIMDWTGLDQERNRWQHNNEPSGSIKLDEFLDWLRRC